MVYCDDGSGDDDYDDAYISVSKFSIWFFIDRPRLGSKLAADKVMMFTKCHETP